VDSSQERMVPSESPETRVLPSLSSLSNSARARGESLDSSPKADGVPYQLRHPKGTNAAVLPG